MIYKEFIDIFIDEVPRYRKRKRKTQAKKANHKHVYKKYIGLLKEEDRVVYFPITECVICGRVSSISLGFYKQTNYGYFSSVNNLEEIKQLNPGLEIKEYTGFPW